MMHKKYTIFDYITFYFALEMFAVFERPPFNCFNILVSRLFISKFVMPLIANDVSDEMSNALSPYR